MRMRENPMVEETPGGGETAKVPHEQRQEFAQAFGPEAPRQVVRDVVGHQVVELVPNSRRPVGVYHWD